MTESAVGARATGAPALAARGLVRRHGERIAVDHVDVEVGQGEIVALVGASGSGKSTVLRGIAGLEDVVAGSVEIGGQDVTSVPTHRRGVGMVFQDGQLFPHRTVARNVGYGLEAAGWDRAHR